MRSLGLTGLAGIALGAGLGACSAEANVINSYKGYETAPYTVLMQDGAIELRSYQPHLVAEVAVRGDKRGAVNRGFQVLAGYIFGGNDASQKISMTAPVSQVDTGESWTIRFMMPTKFDQSALPAPDNAAITFTQVPASTRLAVRFSGRAVGKETEAYEAQLQAFAQANGLAMTGPVETAYFDDPMTLPWNRRNEVSIEVRR